jgi:hypothetical protein
LTVDDTPHAPSSSMPTQSMADGSQATGPMYLRSQGMQAASTPSPIALCVARPRAGADKPPTSTRT